MILFGRILSANVAILVVVENLPIQCRSPHINVWWQISLLRKLRTMISKKVFHNPHPVWPRTLCGFFLSIWNNTNAQQNILHWSILFICLLFITCTYVRIWMLGARVFFRFVAMNLSVSKCLAFFDVIRQRNYFQDQKTICFGWKEEKQEKGWQDPVVISAI